MKIAAETTERKLKYPTRAAVVAIAGVSVLALSGCDDRDTIKTAGEIAPGTQIRREVREIEREVRDISREVERIGGIICPSAYEQDEESEKED